MTTYHGKGARVYIDGYDLSGKSSNLGLTINTDTEDVTNFKSSAHEFLVGLPGWTGAIASFWDDAAATAGGTDAIYQAAIGSQGILSVWPSGTTVGRRGFANSGEYESSFATAAPVAGAVTAQVNLAGNNALEKVVSLAASTLTVASASTGYTGVDYAASLASDTIAGYLHVLSLSPNNMTITACVQQSTDNSTWTALFTIVTASVTGGTRTAYSGSRARYIRGVTTTNASVTSAEVVMAFHSDG